MLLTDQFVQIGQVLKSNGSDGQLVISLNNNADSACLEEEPVFIYFDGLPVPYFVDIRDERGSNKVLAYLTDVTSIKDTEELLGKKVYVRRQGGMTTADEDFTGWTLYNNDILVGTVTAIEDIPGNPCLEVTLAAGPAFSQSGPVPSHASGGTAKKTGTVLVPLHADFILDVDAKKKALRMSLPEGLL